MDQNPCPQNHPPGASDARDFDHVVKNHAALVRATAQRITGNAALAEDVTQETFLALARQGDHALESVAAWLCRVAGRKARNAIRGEARRRRNEAAAMALASGDTGNLPSPLSEPAIKQLLGELPAPWKECLEEHYLNGRTQQEIAQRKGISQSTVSRYLDAGLRELKERLRSKGIVCGTILTVFAGAGSAAASSLSPAGLSGSIAAGGIHSSTPVSTLSSIALAMNATKIIVATAAAVVLVGIPVFLYRDRAEEPVKPAAGKPASKAPAASGFARPGNTKAGSTATALKNSPPEPVSEDLRRQVDALVLRCGNMSEMELMLDPEIMDLMENFMQLFEAAMASRSPRLERAMLDFMASKGVDPPGSKNRNGPAGFAVNFFKPGALDKPLARSWIEAALSNDPKRVEEWMVNRFQGATLEFWVDPALDSSSEGLSVIKPRPAPKKDKGDY